MSTIEERVKKIVAEQLDGYVFTQYGWVQSYGSRCVKPAIIFGDLSRPKAMTVEWIKYAQGLTDKVMKGMLTGPVTMLMWSFPREDVSRKVQAQQLALAIRDEVVDLEAAGIKIVQIDEAAFRDEVLGAGEARLAVAGDSGGAGGDHDPAVRVRPHFVSWSDSSSSVC